MDAWMHGVGGVLVAVLIDVIALDVHRRVDGEVVQRVYKAHNRHHNQVAV